MVCFRIYAACEVDDANQLVARLQFSLVCIKRAVRELTRYFYFVGIVIQLQHCASFTPLPAAVSKPLAVAGLYSNDQDSVQGCDDRKLWSFIDKKYKSTEANLYVRFELTGENKIKAQLRRQNETLSEKTIRGGFKGDNAYYTRKVFYFIPVLPILWGYNHEKYRLYRLDDILVYEYAYDHGGAFIIWASGNKGDCKWYYPVIEE